MKFLIIALVLCAIRMAMAQDWKPSASPLMTRWAKDVSPGKVHAEYPRPQMVRTEWQNLNGLWEFAGGASEPAFGRKLDGQILVPFPMESALSGVGKHFDKSLYRKTFTVPTDWKDKRILLHFGAVDFESTVHLNGRKLGSHTGGYDAFSFDITDALKPGGEQELIVEVTDVTAETQARGKQTTEPKGIWYTPCSGIWQTVWIEPVTKSSAIESLRITPDVDRGGVTVAVAGPADAKIEVLDGDKVVATGKSGELIPVADAKLWSPDSPFLYDLRITAGDDAVQSYFGMRKIEVSPDDKGIPRIKLNGKAIMQVGPLDQGFWPDGIYTAPTDEAMKYDLDVTKKLGFNMIRKHVKVEPQRWYYWADKMGILVWQDMPNAHAYEAGPWQKQFESELEQLIKQHINSPSIIMWVPLNEGWGQDARPKADGTKGAAPYDKAGTTELVNRIRQWDPTRLVNNASGWTDQGAGDVHDIHSYPGPAAPAIEKTRAIVLGEFGGLGLPIEGHLWQKDKNWGYQNMESKDELTDRYVRLLGRLWQLHDDNGLCAGVYTQTTDVEVEVNGLLTYDREVLKVDESRVREANLGKGPRIDIVPVVKTAREQPADWQYTTDKPADGWEKPGFDASSWKTGQSGFGKEGTPGATIRTKWETPDIWLRREVEIPADAIADIEMLIHHDDECQVYINGVPAGRLRNFTTDYIEHRLREEARRSLKPGRNLVAVHCNQRGGGQFIDVGFVKLVESKRN